MIDNFMEINDEQIYISKKWDYLEEKKCKYLLIWSSLPKWMVVDKDLFLLLKLLSGKNTLNEVIKKLSVQNGQNPEEIREQLKEIFPILAESQIIRKESEKETNQEVIKRELNDIAINITNRCNLNCPICCNSRNAQFLKEEEISTELIKEFLDQVKKIASDKAYLSISGGEPLLVADKVLDVVRHAKNIGFKSVTLLTNGTLITREFAKEAKKYSLTFQISIDGHTREMHDFIRGNGSFKKTMNGIKILKEEGLFVVTNMVCHRANTSYENLVKYFEFAQKYGIDHARFIPLKYIGSALDKTLNHVPIDEILSISYKVFKDHPEYKKIAGQDYFNIFANICRLSVKFGYCGTGMITVLLNPDGSIYPCIGHALPEFKAGNIRDNSFSEIWFNSPVLKELRKIYNIDELNEKCSKCIVRHWCLGGCRAEAYHMTHKLNSPDFQCEKIKKSIIEMFWFLSEETTLGKGDVYKAD